MTGSVRSVRAIDFRGALRQNTLVRKMIAGNAVALLVIITFLAPLFHLHTDEHGQALIHAHFPVVEISDVDAVEHMEAPHSHGETRSIDVLTTTAAPSIQLDSVILTTPAIFIPRPAFYGSVRLVVPWAHAPPEFQSLLPRAPPA